ncbi:hypothetical protein TVAG_178540 [Trichomonas vaginalis G3]|uniref:DUF3447 domain-containing protein n=1 Tax=Trichomonas vaginalis (strain ATCC PRA-98 / G3) TaxID=412133 RepID=A2DIK6_TRIV3|nr:protein of unknown function (DUF3447) [Trichomonas vaginalis G3]EAY19810.1 hypothetical protein TVAG_178540 [Trichomonas vaginalis G3]KAI5524013.1 protein of unknown function (DUF3447) [Trichomonas vaginalis G3]|eukprot:XP_001580796.1 hypothetical protein [Trichomonas vaginalis G3]
MIKTELIDSKKHLPVNIIRDISGNIPYNNRYTKSYLYLIKRLSDNYHLQEVKNIFYICNYLFYKEYGIKLDKSEDFETINIGDLEIHSKNTIYKAIMNNDIKSFISFTEAENFNINDKLRCKLYPEDP